MESNKERYFAESELLLRDGGKAIYHIGLRPDQLADNVILVGDPDRVPMVAAHFDECQCRVQQREFHSATGLYRGKRITVLSTGIGCDNIDIVLNELDALCNIDFATRRQRPTLRSLNIVRIGSCGGLQPYTPVGSVICSVKSIGFDGLLNFYGRRDEVCDLSLEEDFVRYMQWSPLLPAPYTVAADAGLVERIATDDMVRGITVACGGFFGPQGRRLRIPLAFPQMNEKIENYRYGELRITNFEMESSAVAGLSRLLGHRAATVCLVIANRLQKNANVDYHTAMDELIVRVLDRI